MRNFSPMSVVQKYQELLAHLTTGSRDLINELTALCEQNVDQSQQLVTLIEQRIRKCLPRYKLYGFYLIDLIVKNVGNPYNSLFETNLYQIFTETYLLVTDTTTRQHLIDTFTTWNSGVSSTGTHIFNKAILDKIEQFVIRATSIKEEDREKSSTPAPALAMPRVAPIPPRISPDHFHREFNLLLQYIIKLNQELADYDDTQFSKKHLKVRNDMVSRINELDEAIIKDSKTEFNLKINFYHNHVVEIRSILDQENFKQSRFISKYSKPVKASGKYIGVLKLMEKVEDNDQMYEIVDQFGIKVDVPVVVAEAESSNLLGLDLDLLDL